MRAISYDRYGEVPGLTDVDEPDCPSDGVLVRVAASGVCRSDWHAWQGHDPVPLPMVPGHEFAGTVDRVGPGVSRWAVGDRVTAPFVQGCGRCGWCREGQAQVCPQQSQPGFTGPGSFAELVAVRAADLNLVRLPDEIDPVAAAALGCRVATAHRALTVHGQVRAGTWVAVHGCGGVGLSAVMIGRALGARVIATDVDPAARERARELGADRVLEAGPAADAEIADLSGGGVEVSLDAVGSRPTVLASLQSLRPRGRHVQVGLLLGEDARPPIPLGPVVAKELSIHGSHGMAAADYPALLALVVSGALRPQDLIGAVIGLEQVGTALAQMSGPARTAGLTVARLL